MTHLPPAEYELKPATVKASCAPPGIETSDPVWILNDPADPEQNNIGLAPVNSDEKLKSFSMHKDVYCEHNIVLPDMQGAKAKGQPAGEAETTLQDRSNI